MENNKICPKCGTTNKLDSNFCTNCGMQLTQNNVEINEQNNIQQNNDTVVVNEQNNGKSTDTNLGVISLVLYFFAPSIITGISQLALPESLKHILSTISGLCPLTGIIVMIVGRIKYPNNKFLKIVMWLIIGSIAIGLILFILFYIWCWVNCSQENVGNFY